MLMFWTLDTHITLLSIVFVVDICLIDIMCSYASVCDSILGHGRMREHQNLLEVVHGRLSLHHYACCEDNPCNTLHLAIIII